MATEERDLFEAIYTNRSIRRFRPDPVPDELLERLLDAAIRAPSGAARQNWRFVVVRDPSLRAALGRIYQACFWEVYTPERQARAETPQQARVFRSASYLADHMATEPPALLLACLENTPDSPPTGRTGGSSIYPAVQNLLLAARGLGLGGCLTTLHLRREDEVKALLGIPDHVDTYALVPIGYPAVPFGPLTRRPVSEVAYHDRWGQVRLTVEDPA